MVCPSSERRGLVNHVGVEIMRDIERGRATIRSEVEEVLIPSTVFTLVIRSDVAASVGEDFDQV